MSVKDKSKFIIFIPKNAANSRLGPHFLPAVEARHIKIAS